MQDITKKLLKGKDFFNILEFFKIEDSASKWAKEYLQQALDFLSKAKSEILIKYDGFKVREDWGVKKPRDNYEVLLKNPKGSYKFRFTASIAHSTKINQADNIDFKVPNAYDILACLGCIQLDSVDEYIQEFGIEINSADDYRRAEKTFKLIKKEELALLRMYTSDEIEMLREIN